MILANALLRHHARDFAAYLNGDASGSSVVLERQIVAWFEDDGSDETTTPFSIHRIATTGAQLGTAVGKWFGPQFACDVIRELFKTTQLINRAPTVFVTNDATIYRDELEKACAKNSQSAACLILVPNRLGFEFVYCVCLCFDY